MHAFPCESISKAGVHYQHNGPADGGSCHTRLLASEEGRQPCSEGGLGRVTGQGRAPGGCMNCSLDHTRTSHITIGIFVHYNIIKDKCQFNCHVMPELGTLSVSNINLLTDFNYLSDFQINLCLYTVLSGLSVFWFLVYVWGVSA